MTTEDTLTQAMATGFPDLVGKGKFTDNETVTLPTETIMDLLDGRYGGESADQLFSYVANVYCGEWRWGNTCQLVIRDVANNFWALDYRESSGDNYYNSLSDFTEHEFYPVKQVETKIFKYVRI